MGQERLLIRKVAVLGAGVMGAQIAAQCVNAGMETLLFDLAPKEGKPNAISDKAIAHLKSLKPSPLGTVQAASLLKAQNYEEDLEALSQCDLIIEAIAERLDWKEALYKRITPFLTPASVLVSNTSGLSINTLASVLPRSHQYRFCGVHFFNPPRYMHLAELIPADSTAPWLVVALDNWLTSYLGKGVVHAKDTPNFIANRIGVFSLLATMYHAEKMGLGLDEVDALTGSLLGRPKSATFRTMDVVGLDTLHHVVETMQVHLKDDPWHPYYQLPDWLLGMIQNGDLGQKTAQGVYRKRGAIIEVYDLNTKQYRVADKTVHPEVKALLLLPSEADRMQALFQSELPQAQFLAACCRDLFHYCAFHLEGVANTVRDCDLAMRWGFGWQQGPFETWQAGGLQAVTAYLVRAILEGSTLTTAPLPTWLPDLDVFYKEEGAYAPVSRQYEGRSDLPVYRRQIFKECVGTESEVRLPVLFENEGVVLSLLEEDVGVLRFKSKANCIGEAVVAGIHEALSKAESTCLGVIIHQQDPTNFSAGADLRAVGAAIQAGQFGMVERLLSDFQRAVMRIKYCKIPVVSALRGRALGGGAELILHSARVVAAFESYPGLVEVGVGLIPGGGGCKEMAMRAAKKAAGGDLFPYVRQYVEQIAKAVVGTSAPNALEIGYLEEKDSWVMHPNEVLFAAVATIRAMQDQNYAPPIPALFPVAGREGAARLQAFLLNGLEGGFLSPHDYLITTEVASLVCGGDVSAGEWVDESWILRLEREAFMRLAALPLTQARISHVLTTGKPLRN